MKNGDHPLIRALKSKGKLTPAAESQRVFELQKEDIHPMARPDIGDNLHMHVYGRVKHVGDDGSMTMHVDKVDHQFPEEEVAGVAKEPIITTQQSNVP